MKEYAYENDTIAAEESLKTVSELFFITTNILSEIIDAKDPYTEGHSERVRLYSVEIARELGLSEKEIAALSLAAKLHDIGKVKIEDRILKKKSKLTPEERSEMERHPIYSEDLLGRHPVIETVIQAIRSHHEYLTGDGYPDKLKGVAIPKLARIISVADVFDALTSNRVYRKKTYSSEDALKYIIDGKGTKFDENVADALLKLSTNGIIDYCNGNYYFRKQPSKALELFKKSLNKYKRDDIDKIYLMIGLIENNMWNPEKAIEIFKKGISIHGKYYYRILSEIAFSKYYMGKIDALHKNYLYFIENKGKISHIDMMHAYFGELLYFWKIREFDKAIKIVRELDKMFYKSEIKNTILKKDTILLAIEKKRENFNDIIRLQSKGYNIMGEIMYDLGDFSQSLRFYNNSISIKSVRGDLTGRAMSLLGSAKAFLRMGSIGDAETRAINSYRTNLERDDEYGMFLSSLVLTEIYLKKKNYQDALYYLEKANKLKSSAKKIEDHNKYYITRWLYHIETEKNADIIIDEIKNKLLEQNDFSEFIIAESYYCLGRAYHAKNNNLEAIENYKKALDIYKRLKIVPDISKVESRMKEIED